MTWATQLQADGRRCESSPTSLIELAKSNRAATSLLSSIIVMSSRRLHDHCPGPLGNASAARGTHEGPFISAVPAGDALFIRRDHWEGNA